MSDAKPPPRPVLDDFGNPAGGLPGRTFQRKQGCWNCLFSNFGERYHKHAADRKVADEKAYKNAGMAPSKAKAKATATYNFLVSKAGHIVLCTAGGVSTDFVANRHLCGKWTGVTGVVGSFEGERFDPLVEELYDRLGETPGERLKGPGETDGKGDGK